jgi:CDP-diacylglycerol--glycerol-3-phosphate 3-phosphatidyltransferase
MNLPNKLTLLRVVMIPLLVIFMLVPMGIGWQKWIAVTIFVLASLTDLADGKIARRYNLITNFGKFMDPLADKVLVLSAMSMFVEWNVMPAWVLILVLAREFAVSGLRLVAVDNGRVIAAAWSGKIKTTVTMIGIILMMAIGIPQEIEWLNTTVWILIAATTVYSGAEYFLKNKDVLSFK